MSNITSLDPVRSQFKQIFAPNKISIGTRTVQQLGRLEFNFAAVASTAFLVYDIGASVIFGIGTALTFGNQNMKDRCVKHAADSWTDFRCIPIGFIGFLFPLTINSYVLKIPQEGLTEKL